MQYPFSGFGQCVAIIAVAVLTTGVAAAQQESLETRLKGNYTGEFRWNGDRIRQVVDMRIVDVNRVSQTRLEAIGCGRYIANGVITNIRIKMAVEEPSLDVEIWVSSPVGDPKFVTDGSHKGRLTEFPRRIEATWTTKRTGQQGKLAVSEGGNLGCDAQMRPVSPGGAPGSRSSQGSMGR